MTPPGPDEGAATRSSSSPGPTASGRTTIDLTALETAPTREGAVEPGRHTATWAREADDTGGHLLRLCLDLQLDALLLSLGAAASQQVSQGGSARTQPGSPPWRRWVEEDVDLATTLAADALAGRATLPSTLGNDVDHQVPAIVIDNLAARYECMGDLLTDLLGRDASPQDDGWRPQVREALRRCRTRLVELHEYRLSGTPPRGLLIDVPGDSATASPLAPEHRYLPGELLG
jgi:hypothetical protein